MSATDPLEPRCSTAIAARYLGVTRRHVQKLIKAGALQSWDLRLPDKKRASLVVSVASIRQLLLERQRNRRTEDPKAAAAVVRSATSSGP